jgi:hypothetical protein
MRDLEVQEGFVKSDKSSDGQSKVSLYLFLRDNFTNPS